MSTFVALTTLMRGERPATQGGFFCVPAKGSLTYKRRLAFTVPGHSGITRASGVVSSGIVRAAFLFRIPANYIHHAHHTQAQPATPGNHNPARKRAANRPCPQSPTRRTNGGRFTAASAGIFAAFTAVETGIKSPNWFKFINLQCARTL